MANCELNDFYYGCVKCRNGYFLNSSRQCEGIIITQSAIQFASHALGQGWLTVYNVMQIGSLIAQHKWAVI